MDASKLLEFLHKEQGELKATLQEAEQLLVQQNQQQQQQQLIHSQELKIDDFFQLLCNGSLNAALYTAVHQDMTQPVSQYYIYTGHNSYLTGNQLNSDCSVVPIIDALRRGVRVIELDLWPTTDKENIEVLHGKTLTDPVDFEKCIVAIKENAFSASEYPVVITLEDHLTTKLQGKAAEIIERVLANLLFCPSAHALEDLEEFPAPETLKGQILISTKPPKEDEDGEKTQAKVKHHILSAEVAKLHMGKKVKMEWGSSSVPEEKHEHVAHDIAGAAASVGENQAADKPLHPKYAGIISIPAGKMSGSSFKEVLVVGKTVKRISLSEPQLEKVVEESPELLVKFTQRNIVRVYPSGMRVDSSNYSPILGWTHGAQMVALNMQGYGKHLWLLHGFFKANGGCGYVKKPDFLLEMGKDGEVFDPLKPRPVKTILKVKLLTCLGWKERSSKHHPLPDFYIRMGIAGVPADSIMKKTKVVEDSWTPTWDTEFEFPLTVPELALIRIEVQEEKYMKDDFEGQSCLPISELKSGYRCVQLLDKKGFTLAGVRMLLHFQLNTTTSL
ncbi:unnamed protein product [Sphagnum jensenii]|uniref:Phosphoinositide phospholipase C n=2 Tax=Sphagnum jensenii TaxID=128206 RepID=A0ABP0XG54_9BRYO